MILSVLTDATMPKPDRVIIPSEMSGDGGGGMPL